MVTGTAFWKSVCVPAHTHGVLPDSRACEEKAALSVYNVPFAADAYFIPLVTWIGSLSICVDVITFYTNAITESFHGSGESRTLSFVIDKSSPGCIGVIILPASSCIATVTSQIEKSCQGFVIIAHSFSDVICFEALNNSSDLCELACSEGWSVYTVCFVISAYGWLF